MNKIISFFKLIRLKNLIIIAITQLLIKFCLINPPIFGINPSLSNAEFYLLVLATVLITASGYIINDIYDVTTDIINKDQKRIIEKSITSKSAILWYIFLNAIGLLLAVYIAYIIQELVFALIFLFCIVSLWIYSKNMKRSFLLGNLQIAFLTGLSILNVALFDIVPNADSEKIKGELIIFKIILCYTAFAFITTLIREIVKDIEDIEGDKKINAKTIAITCGIRKTKWVGLFLTTLTFFGITYFQYFQYSVINSQFEYEISGWGINKIAIFYSFLMQILLLLLGINIYRAQVKKEFYFISQLCKIIMIIGILSIPLFTYLHLN